MDDETIHSLVRRAKDNYTTGTTKISKYVDWSLYENVEKIDAYLNSKHVSGDKDSMGRDKPFFNIVTAAVNIWYRATDIDRKNIRVKATKETDIIGAFLATIHLQEWMRRENFGTFLNEWGRNLARYGSTVVKFVEKGGRLYPSVIPWGRLIVDAVDFDANVKIERLYYTPAQLKAQTGYNQKVVDNLIEAATTRKTMSDERVDNDSNFIELYEVHGEMPLSYITGNDEDDDTFVQQMHVISYVAGKEEGKYNDFSLFSGRESKDPYMITHLIKEDGRVMGIGAVEHLFESQWMVNHSTKAIKDQLDLASKLIFQTSDTTFVGQNALTSIETGDIMIHSPNAPLTQIANNSHDITSLQNFSQQWQTLAQQITSTPDAISGGTMPSGTAYRQVAILNQESHSLFEIMTENKGLHIEEMMRNFVLPYIKTKMDSSDEIAATLSSVNLAKIDTLFVNATLAKLNNELIKKTLLSGKLVENIDLTQSKADLEEMLKQQGNQRFFVPSDVSDTTWKELFKDLEWEVEVEITNETSDKEAVMTTLTTVLQTVGSNPQILQDPNMRVLFNKIVEATGVVSPMELTNEVKTPQPAPQPAPTPTAQPIGGA